MKKRPGITRLPDGRYFLRVTARCPFTQTKVHRKRTVAPMSLEDAVIIRSQMAKTLKAELARGKKEEVKVENITVATYAEHWIQQRVSRLKSSTQVHYLNVLADRVLPVVGEIRVNAVTRSTVEYWVLWAEAQRSPRTGRAYSKDTLSSWWRVLKTMLKDAAAEFGLPDPTTRVMPPRSSVCRVRERKTLTAEELGRLLRVTRDRWPEWYAEVYVMAYTGMRPGELYGLRWEDIDFGGGCIRVQRAVWRGHEGATKTDDPREVALPQTMKEVLVAHRQTLLKSQHASLPSGLVFPASNGRFRMSSALYKVLRQLGAMAELPMKVGPQVLRRTLNTLMLEQGVDHVVLRSQMGHSSAAMTRRYAGIHIERKQEAVTQLIGLTEVGNL